MYWHLYSILEGDMSKVLRFPQKQTPVAVPCFTMMHNGEQKDLPVSIVQAVVEGRRPRSDIPDEFALEMYGDWLQWKLEEVL
jgi:hypothetical protein